MKSPSSIFGYLQLIILSTILTVLGSLIFSSCASTDKDPPENPPLSNCAFAGGFCENYNIWIDAPAIDINNSFQVALGQKSKRVLSYQIDRASVNQLLKMNTSMGDSAAALRIYLALNTQTQQETKSNEPAFRPLIKLINTKENTTQDSTVFAMDYIDINIIHYLDSLISSKPETDPNPDIKISARKALKMITAWDTLPKDSIAKVIYKNAQPNDIDRARYYTFNSDDTAQIFDRLASYTSDILYLHLGVFYETDSIPFRTIIHIDDPAHFPGPIIDPTHLPLFEFAVPCPKFCKD